MKDIMGNDLKVGQIVVYGMGQSMTLLVGTIDKINNKTVTIHRELPRMIWDRSKGGYIQTGVSVDVKHRTPENVVVVG